MKRPKMLKMPRKPRRKTVKSMRAYLDRVKKVESENKRKLHHFEAEKRELESLKRKIYG